jgi:hypothetical protein
MGSRSRRAGISGMEKSQTQLLELEDQPGAWRAAESDRVFAWRLDSLKRAGYQDDAAFSLANGTHVDLHFAVDLVERGCPAPTATRILL